MRDQCAHGVSRREFLGRLTLAAGLLGLHARPVAAEPLPETTRLRLARHPGICVAPYFLAKEFLPAEGFTDVQDVKTESTVPIKAVVAGEVDIALNFSGPLNRATQHWYTGSTRKRVIAVRPGHQVYESCVE
jgi:ABC-type nitrate/sulfonate/bicarbonate transport system substrate-binding protein